MTAIPLLALALVAPADTLDLPGGAQLVPRDVVAADSARGWSFHATVPKVVGPDGGRPLLSLDMLSRLIETRLEAERDEFIGAQEEEPDSFARALIADGGGSFYESGYEVALAEEGVLALSFAATTYYVGAAHPNHTTWSIVWDLETGHPIGLDEVFRQAYWYEWVSERAVALLEAGMGEMGDPEWIREGAGPDPDHFRSWVPTPEGIRITFDEYQVAPYAAGPQEVVIVWDEVAPHLDPGGPLAAVAARHGARLP